LKSRLEDLLAAVIRRQQVPPVIGDQLQQRNQWDKNQTSLQPEIIGLSDAQAGLQQTWQAAVRVTELCSKGPSS
jgi:hypothetical protein